MAKRIRIIDGHPDANAVRSCVVGMVELMSQAGRGEWLAHIQVLGQRGQ
jgi:hypothetical protein